jgi:general secretion pathway protein I
LPISRSEAGFTILEVLVALAIVAVAVVAIGAVMSTNARGVRALESHVALMQTAQTVLATQVPQRKDLRPGVLSGELHDFRWQIDVGPVGGDWIVDNADVAWIPELVKVRVRAASGAAVELETVRLMQKPGQEPGQKPGQKAGNDDHASR